MALLSRWQEIPATNRRQNKSKDKEPRETIKEIYANRRISWTRWVPAIRTSSCVPECNSNAWYAIASLMVMGDIHYNGFSDVICEFQTRNHYFGNCKRNNLAVNDIIKYTATLVVMKILSWLQETVITIRRANGPTIHAIICMIRRQESIWKIDPIIIYSNLNEAAFRNGSSRIPVIIDLSDIPLSTLHSRETFVITLFSNTLPEEFQACHHHSQTAIHWHWLMHK